MLNGDNDAYRLVFDAVSESKPGPKWQARFQALWPAYERWYLSEGAGARPTYLSALRAFKAHMPELVPTYEQLTELAGGSDLAARFLTFFCPPAYLSGCSQAIWPGNEPLLVRNYDYAPQLSDGLVLETKWNGMRVLGISDGLFGMVDGINEAGLAVSLTFGGRKIVGEGFGVPIIVRYILEFCKTAKEAAAILARIPCHMAYNVTVIDKNRRFHTVYLSPDREAIVTDSPVATNHQERVEWHRHARATATVERERFLLQRLQLHNDPAGKFIGAFLRPPLYSTEYARGFGTLYTAVYWPKRREMEMRWQKEVWKFKLGALQEGSRVVHYPWTKPA